MIITPDNPIQHRNMTPSQKRNIGATKEGVIVNNFIDVKDTYIISDNTPMPQQLYNDKKVDKKLLPLSAITLGVMSSIALLTAFVNHSAKVATTTAKEKWLPAVTRNVNLSKETYQVIYQMVQNPNRKTFTAGAGVLALSAMAFMGKTFFDGYKDIWVKRKEADIQKNLQENLISVETEAFSGKMQIIRSMLSKYTKDFENYLSPTTQQDFLGIGKKHYPWLSFTGNNEHTNNVIGNIALAIGTVAGIVGFGYLSLRNLSKSKTHLEKYINDLQEGIKTLVKNSTEKTRQTDKENLEHLFVASDATEEFVREQVNSLHWGNSEEKHEFIEKIINKMRISAAKVNPNIGGDGTPKPAFNSFVDDYRAFFYNWLLDTANPQFKQLFLGVTGIAAASYGGKLAGDAIKEVQVKKINAETELNLQQRLVSTELRNFKAKKDAAIAPLVEEFYKQVNSGTRTKEELRNMAENILAEIKNGPPFVYS